VDSPLTINSRTN